MALRFWMSGEIMHDVGESFREAHEDVERAINLVLSIREYGSGLAEWDHIVIILSFDDPVYHEVKRYQKRSRDVEFRLKIPHSEFKAADSRGQRVLLMSVILRSIEEMRAMRIPDFDLDKLEADMRELAAAKGWL